MPKLSLAPLALLSSTDLTFSNRHFLTCSYPAVLCLSIDHKFHPLSLSNAVALHQCYRHFSIAIFLFLFLVTLTHIHKRVYCPFCLHWFYFFFYSSLFRLTHSLTLMHASLLENGCTSLPGESVTHSPAWFSHDQQVSCWLQLLSQRA